MRSDRPESIRVLVAEDDPQNQKLLREVCLTEGYDADGAGDGLEALERMTSGSYQLLLLDAAMPGKSGFEVVEALSKDPKTAGVPIIMISANPHEDARTRAERLGVFAYIEKPFRIFDLTQKIRLALRRPRRDDEPPTLPPARLRRTMGDALTKLPPPGQLRPYLRRALDEAAAAGRPVACVVVRLESGPELLLLGRTLRDAALGAMAVKAAEVASGPVHRSDENELCWLLPPPSPGEIDAIADSLEVSARSMLDLDPAPPVEVRAGVALLLPTQAAGPEGLLRAARAMATRARREGARAACEPYEPTDGDETAQPSENDPPKPTDRKAP